MSIQKKTDIAYPICIMRLISNSNFRGRQVRETTACCGRTMWKNVYQLWELLIYFMLPSTGNLFLYQSHYYDKRLFHTTYV